MTHSSDLQGRAVLVTGAAGCIGAWTVKLLRDAGAVPVVFDIADNRQRLELIMSDPESVIWELGDITDFERLSAVAVKHNIEAIIHLAALQVPFCKADPINSTKINVLGSVNILELARQRGISRLSYASSIAAPAMADNEWLATLYGAHKVCGEQMAAVYWQDWGVPSVGIRPAIIYGPGRDQGMSAAPTVAMLAATVDQHYSIPFSGDISFVHVEDAASRFIAAATKSYQGAHVFDLNGTPASIPDVLELVRAQRASGQLDYTGDAMPFPANPENGELDALLNIAPCRSMAEGVKDTLNSFDQARERGIDLNDLFLKTVERNS
jgi:nucleoside-diphosphate-sugar epimerase